MPDTYDGLRIDGVAPGYSSAPWQNIELKPVLVDLLEDRTLRTLQHAEVFSRLVFLAGTALHPRVYQPQRARCDGGGYFRQVEIFEDSRHDQVGDFVMDAGADDVHVRDRPAFAGDSFNPGL